MRLIVLGLALLLALTPARAQDALPTVADLEPALGDSWYGVYIQGRKSGWARMSAARGGTEADPTYSSRFEVRIDAIAMGEKLTMEQTEESTFDGRPPYALRSVRSLSVMSGDRSEREATREGADLRVVSRGAEGEHVQTLASVAYGFHEAMAVELFIARRPAAGEAMTHPSLNLDEGELRRKTVTVDGVDDRLLGGVQTKVYRVSVRDERKGPEATAVTDERGRMLTAVMEGFIELRLEDEVVAKQVQASGDLFLEGLVKLEGGALGEPAELKALRLRVDGDARGEMPAGPGQAVTRQGDQVVLVLDRAQARVDATPDEVARATRATPDVPSDHPDVVKLAREAVGDAATPEAKVERLVRFVAAYVEDAYGANALTVHDVIRRKKGDCTEHAELFTALARAVGIPTRTVGGLAYMGDEATAFGGHAWNEVVLDGAWIPVDPTFDQVRADVGHVRLGYDGGPDAQGRVFGRVRFTLLGKE